MKRRRLQLTVPTVAGMVIILCAGVALVLLFLRVQTLERLVEAREIADPLTPIDCVASSLPCPVKFDRLLAAPQQFHNRLISIEGYFAAGFEMSALFQSEADYLERPSRALWVYGEKESKDINLKTVRIVGVFKRGPAGHMFDYAGALENAKISD